MNIQTNPYIGPRTFQRNEGHLFFGREREARDLIALVASERLVVFYAQSGAGKSSIVNTRLIPNLEKKEYEVLPVGRVSGDTAVGLNVDNIYIYNLVHSLEQHETNPAGLSKFSLSHFLAHLNADEKGFFYDSSPVEAMPVGNDSTVIRRALIIDQFEELFSTHPEAWESREDFFRQVAQAMQDDPYLWVVLVMREDYIAAVDAYAHLLPNGLRIRYYMQRLGREAALKAVVSPVETIRPYAKGVAEKLIDDLCSIKVQKPDGTLDIQPGQYVEPVQMQVVCYGLWENLPPDGTQITEKDLEDVGDVNQSLGKYYDRRVGEVAKTKNVRERLIREWFEKKLITVGGIRNMVLQEREARPGDLPDEVIQALQSDLVRGEKRGGATWYELTHDRLVEPILERNKIWFNENLSPLQRQASLWKDQEQNESWLLRDQALIEVEGWAKEHSDELTDVEKEFLKTCQEAQAQIEERHAAERRQLEMTQRLADEQTRSAQRSRRFNIIALGLALISIVATGIALTARQTAVDQADRANIALTAAALANDQAETAKDKAQNLARIALAGDLISHASDSQIKPDLAALLKMQAYKEDNNSRTRQFLLSTLQDFSGLNSFLNQSADQISFSPDKKIFATLSNGGVTLWDLNFNPPKKLNSAPLNGHVNPVYPIAFNKDGSILASASQDGTVVIWDVASGKQLTLPLQEHAVWIDGMAFSPTKDILATCADDLTVILWDASVPEKTHKLSVLSGHTGWVANVVFSSDGKTLASTDATGSTILWDVTDPENPKELKGSPIATNATTSLNSVAFGKNDKTLATATNDGTIIFWDISNREKPMEIVPHLQLEGATFASLAFNSDRTKLVASTYDSITFWDVKDPTKPKMIGELLTEFAGTPLSSLGLVAFSSDDKTLTSGSNNCDPNCKIFVWDVSTLEAPKEFGAPLLVPSYSYIHAVAINPDGNMLAAGTQNGSVLRWDLTNKSEPTPIGLPLKGHTGLTTGLSFSPDGNLLISTGNYGDSILIDVASQTMIGTGDILPYTDPDKKVFLYHYIDGKTGEDFNQILEIDTGKKIGAPIPGIFLDIDPSKKFVVYQTVDNNGRSSINLWDVATGKPSKTEMNGSFLGFSANSQILAYQQFDRDEKVWIHLIDTTTGDALPPPLQGLFQAFSPDSKILYYQTYDEDGSFFNGWNIFKKQREFQTKGDYFGKDSSGAVLAYSSQDDKQGDMFIFMDTSTAKPMGEPIPGVLGNFYYGARTLIYQYSNKGLNYIGILNTETGVTTSLEGGIITSSPDNQKLVYQTLAAKPDIYAVNVLDMATGDLTVSDQHSYLSIYYQYFSPDNSTLVYQSYDSATGQYYFGSIDLNTGTVTDSSIAANFLGFGSGNETVAYVDYNLGTIGILDTNSGEVVGAPVSGSYSTIDPDHKTLIYQTSSINNNGISTIGLLDMKSGIGVDTHIAGNFLGFTPDNKKAIYQANDSVIGLLDLSTGQSVGRTTLRGIYLTYSPTNNLIASRDNNGMINLWNLPQAWSLGDPVRVQASAPIQTAVLNSDGNILASINEKGLFLQNLTTNSEPLGLPNEHVGGVSSVEFSPTGSSFLTIGYDNKLILWGWDKNSKPYRMSTDPINGSWGTFSPDGKTLIVVNGNKNTTSFINADSFEAGSLIAGSSTNISPDGKTLVVADITNGKSTLWDLTTLERIGDPLSGTNIQFGSTGKFLATYDESKNTTTLFDLITRKTMDEPFSGNSPSFSPGDNVLLIQGVDPNTGNYKFSAWRLTNQRPSPLKVFNAATSIVGSPVFSPNGKFLILSNSSDPFTGNYDNRLWNLDMDDAVIDIQGFLNNPVFSRDEKFLAGEQLGHTSLWNITNPKTAPQEIPGIRAQFSPMSQYLLTSDQNTIYLWDLTQNLSLFDIPITVESFAFSPDDTYLAVSDKELDATSIFKLAGASPQTVIKTIPGLAPQFDPKGKFLVTSKTVLNLETGDTTSEDHSTKFYLEESPDGNTMAIYGDRGVAIWDYRNNPKTGQSLSGHTGFIAKTVFSPQKNILATVASDGIILRDISDPSHEKQIGNLIPGTSIDFSSDGRMIAVGDDGNKQTSLWEISESNEITSVGEPLSGTRGIFSPDKTYLVTVDLEKGNILVWNLAKKNFDTPEKEIPGTYSRFSKDGELMAVFNLKSIQAQNGTRQTTPSSLWNMRALSEIKTFTLTTPCDVPSSPDCMLAAFSPDGKILAYIDGANVVLWDTQNQIQLGTIGTPSGAKSLAFIFEGIFATPQPNTNLKSGVLVIGSYDGTFTLWEIPARIRISDPIPGTFVAEIPKSTNHTLIYISNDTNELISWDFNPVKWMELICARVNRNLTRDEWGEFLENIAYPEQEQAACPKLPIEPEKIYQGH